jgi:predicted nucleotidyltransferase
MSQLEEIIDNLKLKPEVDAVFVAGSQGVGEEKSYSDIDLVVIFTQNLENLRSLFQWIDNKPGDIYFFDHSDIEKLLSLDEIPANKMDAVLIDWLEKNSIHFDKSGLLTKLKGQAAQLKSKFAVPTTEMKSFEQKINYGYIRNKRYFESENSFYQEALEINLLNDIPNVLVGYFEFRNIPWRGEKFAINYLKSSDPTFYNLFLKCIGQSNLKEKFDNYSRLVQVCFHGDYKLWTKNTVVPFPKDTITDEKEGELINYWNRLKS